MPTPIDSFLKISRSLNTQEFHPDVLPLSQCLPQGVLMPLADPIMGAAPVGKRPGGSKDDTLSCAPYVDG